MNTNTNEIKTIRPEYTDPVVNPKPFDVSAMAGIDQDIQQYGTILADRIKEMQQAQDNNPEKTNKLA